MKVKVQVVEGMKLLWQHESVSVQVELRMPRLHFELHWNEGNVFGSHSRQAVEAMLDRQRAAPRALRRLWDTVQRDLADVEAALPAEPPGPPRRPGREEPHARLAKAWPQVVEWFWTRRVC